MCNIPVKLPQLHANTSFLAQEMLPNLIMLGQANFLPKKELVWRLSALLLHVKRTTRTDLGQISRCLVPNKNSKKNQVVRLSEFFFGGVGEIIILIVVFSHFSWMAPFLGYIRTWTVGACTKTGALIYLKS